MLEALGLTLEFIGVALIAYSVLSVHVKLTKEHKIDKVVEKKIIEEEHITMIGFVLIFLGYLLQMVKYF